MIVDAVEEIVSLLQSNWNSANTDGVTPQIKAIYELKRIGGLSKSTDYVLVYEGRTSIADADVSGISRHRRVSLSIDVRTFKSRGRMVKILKEVDRILWSKIAGTTNFEIAKMVGYTDLSDRSIKLWRVVYDVELVKLAEVRA